MSRPNNWNELSEEEKRKFKDGHNAMNRRSYHKDIEASREKHAKNLDKPGRREKKVVANRGKRGSMDMATHLREWHKQNPGKRGEYARKYANTEEGKRKNRARQKVHKALRDGRLIRPELCELCGNKAGVNALGRSLLHAHHWHGYDDEHALDVQWVCIKCDGLIERKYK